MDWLVPSILLVFGVAVIVLIINWCILDARMRGKSPIFVVIAVLLCFPWGWIAWLIFRPPPIPGNEPFDINQFRKQ